MNRGNIGMLALLALLAAAPANGQQPSTEDIIKRLEPSPIVLPEPGLRTLPWGKKGITEEGEEQAPSIDLHVQFEYNSDKLMPDAIFTLRRLGAALKNERLAGYRFRIAGHTDAKGSVEYNQQLSERRAQAVRDYLVFQYDLEPHRLETIGFGKSQLADANNPEDGINRRVQVINVGSNKVGAK